MDQIPNYERKSCKTFRRKKNRAKKLDCVGLDKRSQAVQKKHKLKRKFILVTHIKLNEQTKNKTKKEKNTHQKNEKQESHRLGEDNCNPWTKKGPKMHDMEHTSTNRSENEYNRKRNNK